MKNIKLLSLLLVTSLLSCEVLFFGNPVTGILTTFADTTSGTITSNFSNTTVPVTTHNSTSSTQASSEKKPTIILYSNLNRIKPRMVMATNHNGWVEVKWNKVKLAKGYIVFRNGKRIYKTKSNNRLKLRDFKATRNGKKYVYKVVAYRRVGSKVILSKYSSGLVNYYLKPVSLDSVVKKASGGSASWSANPKASGYELSYSKSKDFKKIKKIRVGANSLSTSLNKLSVKSNYYVRVRSFIKKSHTYFSDWSTSVQIIAFNSNWEFAKNSAIHNDSATLYYASKNKKNKTVCINAGHGTIGGNSVKTLCHPNGTAKVTGGSTLTGSIYAAAVSSGTSLGDGTPEYKATLAIALVAKTKFLKEGYNVLMVRETDDAQLDNIARTLIANEYANYNIAIHYDSSQSDKGAFFIGPPDIGSYRSMYPVSNTWKKHFNLGEALINGFVQSGVKVYGSGSMNLDLTQTSYSRIASVDIEVGDKASDRSVSTVNKIADGLVAGINLLQKRK